jgi:hypothetical protein
LLREQYENIFETIEARGRLQVNDAEGKRFLGVSDGTDEQALREDAVVAGGEHGFAGLHFFVVDDVIHAWLGIAAAFHHAMRARFGKERADAAFFVVDQQNLRSTGKYFNEFADDAVGRNHRQIITKVIS